MRAEQEPKERSSSGSAWGRGYACVIGPICRVACWPFVGIWSRLLAEHLTMVSARRFRDWFRCGAEKSLKVPEMNFGAFAPARRRLRQLGKTEELRAC